MPNIKLLLGLICLLLMLFSHFVLSKEFPKHIYSLGLVSAIYFCFSNYFDYYVYKKEND